MSILVTVAVVCTMSTCNDYVIDTSKTAVTQAAATRAHTMVYNEIWEDEKGLSEWLKSIKSVKQSLRLYPLILRVKTLKRLTSHDMR